MPADHDQTAAGPVLHRVGEAGLLVSFADHLDMAANSAAIAFRAAIEAAGWPGVAETATTLKSVFLRFDPDALAHDALEDRLRGLLATRDWLAAPLPPGRNLWRIPSAFGGAHGPQLAEVADLAGLSEAGVIEEIAATRLRVLTVGFAPGQPYLGRLGPAFDFPRQKALTPRVPKGAIVTAIRQIVLFTVTTPTGWRQIGMTAFEGFRPSAPEPFPLNAGDEVLFEPAGEAEFAAARARAAEGALAAGCEVIE